ncbi:MAG: glycogen-binding domain-containing protein [Kiritimatiellae bacterium]|nr:glycogen-binding domain-containing protein [Kiritimatiellia bacterium]
MKKRTKTGKDPQGKQVCFRIAAEAGSKVYVAGSFNGWNTTQYPLQADAASGQYTATVALLPGRYEYKFLVNGEWQVDSANPEWSPNDLGSLNSVVTV